MNALKIAAAGAVLASMVACTTKVVTPPAQTTVVHEKDSPTIVHDVQRDKPAVQNNITVDR